MRRRFPSIALALLAAAGSASAGERETRVLAALPPLAAIVSALAEGTAVETVGLPGRPASIGTLERQLARSDPARTQLLSSVDAVVTIESLWPQDPLFAAARAENIWVVNIDAAQPYGREGGVGLIAEPASHPAWREGSAGATEEPSPYAWMSPANGIRMAEIIAADLKRMAPAEAEKIEENLRGFREEIRNLKAEYEARFAALEDFTVYALTDQFVYLTNELGLFVDGYFLEQDLRWTEADHAGFRDHLERHGLGVVIHQWEPAEPIVNAAKAAGAEIVVLDAGGLLRGVAVPNGYAALLRHNLELLYRALAK